MFFLARARNPEASEIVPDPKPQIKFACPKANIYYRAFGNKVLVFFGAEIVKKTFSIKKMFL